MWGGIDEEEDDASNSDNSENADRDDHSLHTALVVPANVVRRAFDRTLLTANSGNGSCGVNDCDNGVGVLKQWACTILSQLRIVQTHKEHKKHLLLKINY